MGVDSPVPCPSLFIFNFSFKDSQDSLHQLIFSNLFGFVANDNDNSRLICLEERSEKGKTVNFHAHKIHYKYKNLH